jgi:hypothetical protein
VSALFEEVEWVGWFCEEKRKGERGRFPQLHTMEVGGHREARGQQPSCCDHLVRDTSAPIQCETRRTRIPNATPPPRGDPAPLFLLFWHSSPNKKKL